MKLIHFILISMSISLYSCTDDITLNLEDPQPILVIDGKLSQDSLSTIRLSEIQNYFATTLPNWALHKNAQINLLEDSVPVGTYTYNLAELQFELNYPVVSEHSYHLELTLENGEKYISIPEWVEEVAPIDTIWFELEDGQFNDAEEGRNILIKINTLEPAGQGDFYQWKTYINGEYINEPIDLTFSDDRFVDGQYVNQFEVFSFNEKDFNEYKQNSPTGQVVVTIEQHKITELYFNYLNQVFQQTAIVGSPFSAPPAEIQGNVHISSDPLNRALGYFAATYFDAKSVEVIIP